MNNIFFNKIFKFNNFLIIYLTIIFSCALILLSKSYLLEVNNSISEWTINYQGGFVRRGLLGELFHLISFKFDIPLRDTILFFLSLLFLLYYYLIYYFFKDVVNNKFNIICFFSLLFIIFPLAELEALGRKDILIPTFFIV